MTGRRGKRATCSQRRGCLTEWWWRGAHAAPCLVCMSVLRSNASALARMKARYVPRGTRT
jgi:hypothetical protein